MYQNLSLTIYFVSLQESGTNARAKHLCLYNEGFLRAKSNVFGLAENFNSTDFARDIIILFRSTLL